MAQKFCVITQNVWHWREQNIINPSAWSDGQSLHSEYVTCRGVLGGARMLHGLTHSTIFWQHREKMQSDCFVRVREGAGSLMVWLTVPRNYFFIFFSPLEIWVFFLQSLTTQMALCVSLTRKWNMKRMSSLSSCSWGL